VSVTVPAAQQLIDGKLVGATGGSTYPILNPANGQEIGVAPDGTAEDVEAAIAAARRAFDETDWSTNTGLRVRCLRQLHQALLDEADVFRALTRAEVGMPDFMMSAAGFDVPVQGLKWVTDLLEGYEFESDLGVAEPMGIRSHRTVRREPVGVVAAITPWNVPTQINLAKVGPALAAGCTVVLKPAPDTPWVACELGRLVAEHTDIPPGVFNAVTPRSDDVAALLTTDPRVDMVSFTGSTATGKAIMAAAAPTLKKVFLELGGKSAAIVLDDADIDHTVRHLKMAGLMNNGQACVAQTRILVSERRHDEVVDALADMVSGLQVGDPADESTDVGPLVAQRQQKRVQGYIQSGIDEGAKVVVGGVDASHDRGWYVRPTLFTEATNDMKIAREEIFGPVLTVLRYGDEADAIRIANDSDYGLAGSVWTADVAHGLQIAGEIRTGTYGINMYQLDTSAPFGGFKQSGIGREFGPEGLSQYTEVQSTVTAGELPLT
jgi:aldehyde dehydrogenase (NAD+)